jgi:hypothetical protein
MIVRIGGGRRPRPNTEARAVTGDSRAPLLPYPSLADRSPTGLDAVDTGALQDGNLDWGLSRQEIALLNVANRLKDEFADKFDVSTIEQCLHNCYDRLAWRAKVLAFLPLLAERMTRQHLLALAGVASVQPPTAEAEPKVVCSAADASAYVDAADWPIPRSGLPALPALARQL